ncbi:phosphatidate cytidylyltransferase [Candidatus Pelagibacter sp.]|nr:phosphatidate cytidylyltransferase [Candidatus Pelagibacter sp.]
MSNELIKRILSSLILLPAIIFLIIKGSYFFYSLLFITLIISAYEWHHMSKNKSYYLLGFMMLVIFIYSTYKLKTYPDNNYWRLLIITSICILTDIGGYLFGKTLKGPKITKFSPNKTYAGSIGGIILSISSIPFFLSNDLINNQNLVNIILFFILISATSQIGDITVSYFKRISKIKDTGKIIPGHGGLLDRIDGMIFAFPIALIFLSLNFFENILK